MICSALFAQNITIGQGNTPGVVVTTSHSAGSSSGESTVSSQGFMPNVNSASRFLSQATFGGSMDEINAVATQGFEEWIEDQFLIAKPFNLVDRVITSHNTKRVQENDPDVFPSSHFWRNAWWHYTMTSDDDLRQRVALALSELFVISEFSSTGDFSYAQSTYYDLLLDNAFGNYRTLLEDVTYHPAMALYLTYMNNPRSDTLYQIDYSVWPHDTLSVQYVYPDENYAREVMQLFSIGLCELNIDGSCKTDANGVEIPTYNNKTIEEFAKIFTGFSYGNNTGFNRWPSSYDSTFMMRMQIYDEYHEPGTKYLLNGDSIAAADYVDGATDVQIALDNIFNHPNVGPFVGRFLIQRLVTSNPSPGYVRRVAEAFNGDSQYGSTRGDMKAVIKAILLDEEARNCGASDNNNFGMLREPFVRYTQIGKAFNVFTPSGTHRNAMYDVFHQIQQRPLSSPSVFNFFQYDYQPIGSIEKAGMVAPEFQITNTQTIGGYMNGLNQWLMRNRYVDIWRDYENDTLLEQYYPELDISAELSLVDDDRIPQLIERLNVILAHGKLSETTINTISKAVSQFELYEVDCVLECYEDCDASRTWCRSQCDTGDTNCLDRCESNYDMCPQNIINCETRCQERILDDRVSRVKLAIYLVMASPEYLINR